MSQEAQERGTASQMGTRGISSSPHPPYYEVEVGMLSEDPYPSFKDRLRLLHDEESVTLRLFLDHTITEAYWQQGRVAMTVSSPLTPSTTSIALRTNATASGDAEQEQSLVVESATAWSMAPAWISNEEALSRRQGGNYQEQ